MPSVVTSAIAKVTESRAQSKIYLRFSFYLTLPSRLFFVLLQAEKKRDEKGRYHKEQILGVVRMPRDRAGPGQMRS
jgi:hypothetical protein